MTTATEPNIADLVEKLRARDAALGNWRDLREHERKAFWELKSSLARVLSGLANAPHDLVRAVRDVAEWEAKRDAYGKHRAGIDLTTITDPRELDRLQKLLAVLDGQIASFDEIIAKKRDRRDRYRLALDGHLAAAATLLEG